MQPRTSLTGAFVALLIGAVFAVTTGELALRLMMPQWNEFSSARFITTIESPRAGRVAIGIPGYDGWFSQNNGDFRARIRINAFGLRETKPVEAAAGTIWIVGDSMTFGWGVDAEEMYSTQVAGLSGKPTYNVASPGTDVCGYEALIDRMPAATRPAAVVMGLVLENDLKIYECGDAPITSPAQSAPPVSAVTMMIGGTKLWLTEHSALYNFTAIAVKRVTFVTNFLIWAGFIERAHVYEAKFPEDILDRVVVSTADEVVRFRTMLEAGTPFAVLVVPTRFELKDGSTYHRRMREETVAALKSRGITALDPVEDFRQAGFVPTHFLHDGHWSALGHRIAGEAVAAWLGSLP